MTQYKHSASFKIFQCGDLTNVPTIDLKEQEDGSFAPEHSKSEASGLLDQDARRPEGRHRGGIKETAPAPLYFDGIWSKLMEG